MKICPKCGSVLADNEPYCGNCSFDPDFDSGNWYYGERTYSIEPYRHGDHIKEPEPYVFGEKIDSALCLITWIITIGFIIMINWKNIVSAIWYNIWAIAILILIIVSIITIYEINKKVNSIKKEKDEDKDQQKPLTDFKYIHEELAKSKHKRCPKCNSLVSMDLGICRYCGYDLINRKQTIIKTKIQNTHNSKKQQTKIRKKTNIELKKCPKCGVTFRKKAKKCPRCDYKFK